jgi:hypothetical protein
MRWDKLAHLIGWRRKKSPAPPAPAEAWEFPPEVRDMTPAERHGRELAMGYAYALLVNMGLATGDRNADLTEAWAIGGRLRRLYLNSLRRGAEQP